jgi:hypothetical protein
MSEPQPVEVNLNALRARMLHDGATENDIDLLFAIITTLDQQSMQMEAERDTSRDILRALERQIAVEANEIKALLILMRRYFIAHSCMTGECVAWTDLKKRFGIGQRDEADEAWMAAHTGQPFILRRSADEQSRRRGE